jgi:coniferyl-aldehyde dehydrogenase
MNDITDLKRISSPRPSASRACSRIRRPASRASPTRRERAPQPAEGAQAPGQRYQTARRAMSQDFGYRAAAESKMLDLLGSVLELNHALGTVRRWMKAEPALDRAAVPQQQASRCTYQPKGVVGVIVPWNFPSTSRSGPLVRGAAAAIG